MAAAARRSGPEGLAPKHCASEAVTRCARLGQRPSARGDMRADRSEYVDKLTFLFRNGGAVGGSWAGVA
jgi:hypothetical protein